MPARRLEPIETKLPKLAGFRVYSSRIRSVIALLILFLPYSSLHTFNLLKLTEERNRIVTANDSEYAERVLKHRSIDRP